MNELYFFLHIFIVIAFVLLSLRIGKNGLITCIVLQTIFSNLFVSKQMECFFLHITCSDVYTIGSIFALNLLQERFGIRWAQRVIPLSFSMLLFFMIMTQCHLQYQPSRFDRTHESFAILLSPTPRIVIASICVTALSQKLDVLLYEMAKKWKPHQRVGVRWVLVAFFSQLVDTTLFTFAGLYGLVHSALDVLVTSYLIKLIITSCMAPFMALSRKAVSQ